MKKKISAHLNNVNKSYFEHMKGALQTSRDCFLAGFVAFIHGFFPFLFETTASSIVRKTHKRQSS